MVYDSVQRVEVYANLALKCVFSESLINILVIRELLDLEGLVGEMNLVEKLNDVNK